MQRGRTNAGFSRRFVAALGLSLLGVSAPSVAGPVDGIVFEQPPTFLGGPASDTEFISPFSGQEVWEQNADNVSLTSPAEIRRIEWLGFYGGPNQSHDPPGGDELMRVRFYAARPGDGLPDDTNILFEEEFLNPLRVATGNLVNVGGFPEEIEFSVDLGAPFVIEANTLHWLEIVQVGDIDSTFRWESGFGILASEAFINGIVGDWTIAPGSLAFQLSVVPEPATATLLIAGATLVARRPARAGGSVLK